MRSSYSVSAANMRGLLRCHNSTSNGQAACHKATECISVSSGNDACIVADSSRVQISPQVLAILEFFLVLLNPSMHILGQFPKTGHGRTLTFPRPLFNIICFAP